MIGDLNESLKQLLIDRIPLDPREVEIVFEAPDKEWSGSIANPTINCYLHHIQENHQLRAHDWERQPAPPRAEITRKRLPYRIELHYLITVWASAIEDEQRLLWRILTALMRYRELPVEILKGELATNDWPIPMLVAQPEGMLKNPSDFWSTFEHFMKPSVGCVFTLPLDPEMVITAPPVLSRRWRVLPLAGEDLLAERYSLAGYVLPTADATRGLPGVRVHLLEHGLFRDSDAHGRFLFDNLAPGPYTLEVQVAGRPVQQSVTLPGRNYDVVLSTTPHPPASADQEKGGPRRSTR